MDTSTNPSQPTHKSKAYRVSAVDGTMPAEALPKNPAKYQQAAKPPAAPALAAQDKQTPPPSAAPPAQASTEQIASFATPAPVHHRLGVDLSLWGKDSPLWVALMLSLAAAVSLGITRFAYGLLLPLMRQDLHWTYALAGSMNTANALGYLVGALSAPWLMRTQGTPQVLVGGSLMAAVFMAATGFFLHPTPLLGLRFLAGIASAWVFVAAGVLAARLGVWHPQRSGLLLGTVYGGVGWGIVLSALAVPAVLQWHAKQAHTWTWAWWWLALACAAAALMLIWPARWFHKQDAPKPPQGTDPQATPAPNTAPVPLYRLSFALAGYACFGMGYIGYMTFVIALLRDRGIPASDVTLFYAGLGLAVVASARLWAGLLDRAKAGGALAFLNGLLGVAVMLPALLQQWALMLLSGILFGAVFLSVVASTTALVRHNLPPMQWPAGISAFTVVFALGQIVGPTMVGWIADGSGNLELGLLLSAMVLWVGAVLAWLQQPTATFEPSDPVENIEKQASK